jgi:hypothetical protein
MLISYSLGGCDIIPLVPAFKELEREIKLEVVDVSDSSPRFINVGLNPKINGLTNVVPNWFLVRINKGLHT